MERELLWKQLFRQNTICFQLLPLAGMAGHLFWWQVLFDWDFGEWAALCGCGKGWSRPNLRGALRGFPRSPRGGELSAQPVTRGPQTSGARLLRLSWCYSIYFGSELWSWDHSDLPRVTEQSKNMVSARQSCLVIIRKLFGQAEVWSDFLFKQKEKPSFALLSHLLQQIHRTPILEEIWVLRTWGLLAGFV